MSSDVSDDISDDENRFIGKKRSFDKIASKGWSTRSDGFVKTKSTSHSGKYDSKFPSRKRTSTDLNNNILKAIQRKKNVEKVHSKYSEMPDKQLRLFLKENIDVDPDFLLNNTPKRYLSSVVGYQKDEECKQESIQKAGKAKKWDFTNLSDSFKTSPEVKKSVTNIIQRKRPFEDDIPSIEVRTEPTQSTEDNVNSSFGTDSLQNRLSEEIVICSPSSQSSEEKPELQKFDLQKPDLRKSLRDEKNYSHSPATISKLSLIKRHQTSIGHNNETSIDSANLVTLKKGSDWLKSIEWQNGSLTPNHNADYYDEKAHNSKSRKFTPGGFAEQAAKIENKVRHSRLIWSHQKKGKSTSCLEKCLTVQLYPFRTMNDMILAKGIVVNKPVATVQSDNEMPNPVIPQQGSGLNSVPVHESVTDTSLLNNNMPSDSILPKKHYFLLLKPSIMREFKFTVGSIIRIHPPWQSLDLPTLPYPVILCSYYIDVLDNPKIPENPAKQVLLEDVIYPTDDCKSNGSNQTSTSHKTLSKQKKRLSASSKTTDIRNFFKGQQEDACTKTSDTKSNRVEGFGQESRCDAQRTAALSHGFTGSLLHSYCIRASTFSLCARVQRIWCYPNTNFWLKRRSALSKSISVSNIRYSLIAQDQHFRFFKLQFLNFQTGFKGPWRDLLQNGEGQCYRFDGVKITQMLQPSKYHSLFATLRNIEKRQQLEMQKDPVVAHQPFCYQLTVNCAKSSVVNFTSEAYPSYCSYEISSLDKLTENGDSSSRFSCCAKVICEVNEIFYITDKSLQKKNAACPYIKMSFWSSKAKPSISSESKMLITEAIVRKGSLFVDKYSMVSTLSKVKRSQAAELFVQKPHFADVAKELSFSLSNFSWKTFQYSSEIGDLVTVKGIIINVDEDTAVSWLECNFCHKENLYQDIDSRILCSLCNRVVENPRLNMKMNVSVCVIEMLKASIVIELTCSTTKKMLNIPDDVSQPKCNALDVLHKKIGPMVCFVRSREGSSNKVKFELQEIILS